MSNPDSKFKATTRKNFSFFSCFGGEFNVMSFVWKMIILFSVIFILAIVFSFGIFRSEKVQSVTSKSDVTIINSLTLNRGMLSDVFDAYKKQEEFFNIDLKKIDTFFDPS